MILESAILPVINTVTYADAFASYMQALGFKYTLDSTLSGDMSWWYTLSEASETLRKLASASMAAVFCDHYDNIRILNLASAKEVSSTLTDSDQIIAATVPQSINRSYSGLDISIYNTQLSDSRQLMDLKDHMFPPGNSTTGLMQFSTRPVVRVECVVADSTSNAIELVGFQSTPDALQFKTHNRGVSNTPMSVAVYGRAIEAVKSTYYHYGNNPLMYDNVYTQLSAAAERMAFQCWCCQRLE